MADTTPRFALPFILPGQAQKELFHNEALARIDLALHPAVEGAPVADAARRRRRTGSAGSSPRRGSGDWERARRPAGDVERGRLAVRRAAAGNDRLEQGGGPAAAVGRHRSGGTGALVCAGPGRSTASRSSARARPAVPSPSGGTIIDEEARAAINALTAALMSHGLIE